MPGGGPRRDPTGGLGMPGSRPGRPSRPSRSGSVPGRPSRPGSATGRPSRPGSATGRSSRPAPQGRPSRRPAAPSSPRTSGSVGASGSRGPAGSLGRVARPVVSRTPLFAPSPRPSAAPSGRPPARQRPSARTAPAPLGAPSRRGASPAARVAQGAPAGQGLHAAGRAQRPDATSGRERRRRHQRIAGLRSLLVVAGAVAGALVVALVAFLVLRSSPAFRITSVVVEPTEHLGEEDIRNLVRVPEDATLLDLDTRPIEESLRQYPWVASVSFQREFPSTLRVTVTEQTPKALVVMSSGSLAWYLGSADVWIQPARIDVGEGQSVNDAALARATSEGVLLVTDVPASVEPEAGATASDEVLAAVDAFQRGFSPTLRDQIVRYSAPSKDAVSCTLSNGVEVSLGSATNVAEKEQVVLQLLEKYQGKLLSINVRVVAKPSVKPVDSSNVQAGTGTAGGLS